MGWCVGRLCLRGLFFGEMSFCICGDVVFNLQKLHWVADSLGADIYFENVAPVIVPQDPRSSALVVDKFYHSPFMA